LRLPAGFPDKYRASILKSIELCAVKKHIQNPPSFEIEVLE
jgi:ribosomal protein S12 methylthiotransferase accessory factor